MRRDPFEDDVHTAMSAVRNGGHNLLTHFYGLEWLTEGDGEASASIPARVQSLDHTGRFASTPTLMLADLVLGRAARSYFGAGSAGVTSEISVDLYAPLPAGSELTCRAEWMMGSGRRAVSAGWIIDDVGTRVARVRGAFVTLKGVARSSPDSGGGSGDGVHDTPLSTTERLLLDTLLARHAAAPALHGQCEVLLGRQTLHALDGDEVELRQEPGPLIRNRTGRVQGGVIAGMLFDACRDGSLHGEPDWDLSTFNLRFVHPGLLEGDDLVVTGRIDQRETERGVACVSARLDQAPRSGLALANAIVSRFPYGKAVSAVTSAPNDPAGPCRTEDIITTGGPHDHR